MAYYSDDEKSSINQYIKEIKKFPLLTPEEEHEIAVLVKQGDMAAREKMFNSNLRLVVSVANAKKGYCSSLSFLDLVQEGNIGLMVAVEKFDPNYGTKFSSYATYWIIQRMDRAIQNTDKNIRIPVHTNIMNVKYKRFTENYYKEHQEYPTDEEIMASLDISKETLKKIKDLYYLETSSLNVAINNSDKDKDEVGDFVPDEKDDYEAFLEDTHNKGLLLAIKTFLPPYEYYIIYYRVFANRLKTLGEIGDELNLTRERIRQLEIKIKSKLKKHLRDNKRRADLIGKYSFKAESERLEPLSPSKIAFFNYLKRHLSPVEYYIFYSFFFYPKEVAYQRLSKELNISYEEINKIKKDLREILKPIFEEYRKTHFKEELTALLKTYTNRQLFDLDLGPNSSIVDSRMISQTLKTYTFDYLNETYSSYFNSLSEDNLKLIKRYFGVKEKYEKKDIEEIIKNINLQLLGYQITGELPFPLLKSVYTANISQFTPIQRDIVDTFYLNKMTKQELFSKYSSVSRANICVIKKSILVTLEKMYFNIPKYGESRLTKEEVEMVLNDPNNLFSEEERMYLGHYYGLFGLEELSIEELAIKLGKTYIEVHGKITSSHNKALKCHLKVSTRSQKVDGSLYQKYLFNVQYEMLETNRLILIDYYINGLGYGKLKEKYHLNDTEVSRIIIDGTLRMDYFRFKILNPTIFGDEDLEKLYQNYEYSDEEKECIFLRYFEGETLENISRILMVKKRKLSSLFDNFRNDMASILSSDITLEDIINEINCELLSSVLSEEERQLLSLLFGIKSAYNKDGIALSTEEIENVMGINHKKIEAIKNRATLSLKQKKSGFLVPRFGHYTKEELVTILKDSRIPLSDRDRELLMHIVGINGYPKLSVEEIKRKYNFATTFQVFYTYNNSIVTIKKYLLHELEPDLSYDEDIVPIMKYFSEYEIKLINMIFKEKKTANEIASSLGISLDVARRKIVNVEIKIRAITQNAKLAKKFDFEYARSVLDKPDLPLYGNTDLIKQIYKMYFGEGGYVPLTIPIIQKELHLKTGSTTLINAINTLMMAVKRYEIGYRKAIDFEESEINQFIEENKLNKWQLIALNKYLNPEERKCFKMGVNLPKNIYYQLCLKFGHLPYLFDDLDEEKVKTILVDKRIHLSQKEIDCLETAFCSKSPNIERGKEFMKALKILEPLYEQICLDQYLKKEKTIN